MGSVGYFYQKTDHKLGHFDRHEDAINEVNSLQFRVQRAKKLILIVNCGETRFSGYLWHNKDNRLSLKVKDLHF
jgi:uncharacterized protein with ATP-grasp and redox domains